MFGNILYAFSQSLAESEAAIVCLKMINGSSQVPESIALLVCRLKVNHKSERAAIVLPTELERMLFICHLTLSISSLDRE